MTKKELITLSDRKLKVNYEKYYANKKKSKLYPTEFVLRIFKGSYPKFTILKKQQYKSKSILDLSFGDGRNLFFLRDLGFNVYGTEISKKIIDNFKKKNTTKKIKLRVGNNLSLPFKDNSFDYLVAWNSFYYLQKNFTIFDNLNEVSRIMKKGGFFIGSIPLLSSYYFQNSKKIDKYKYLIKNDYLKIRNDSYLCGLESSTELKKILNLNFKKINIAHSFNDYFGITENLLIFCCQKR